MQYWELSKLSGASDQNTEPPAPLDILFNTSAPSMAATLGHVYGFLRRGQSANINHQIVLTVHDLRQLEVVLPGVHVIAKRRLFLGGAMNHELALIRQRIRAPHAAAIAGILFSLLFTISLLLIWISIPSNPLGPATAVMNHMRTVSLSLNLLPVAGIAFLWFIAVVRDRLGELEDRFFATVFLGSGLLFVAMVFNAAAIAGGIITVLGSGSENLIQSGAYALGRAAISQTMHTYAMRMAGVFMITISTIALKTRIFPHWMAVLGYLLALVLLLSVGTIEWIPLVFPLWVFLISVHILSQNLHGRSEPAA